MEQREKMEWDEKENAAIRGREKRQQEATVIVVAESLNTVTRKPSLKVAPTTLAMF